MATDNEKAILEAIEFESVEVETVDLEQALFEKLESDFAAINQLREEYGHIGSPDYLGETVKNIVLEQFMNQVAVIAGEDFIEENRGMMLDLSRDAHIQTAENFEYGKLATHNTEIDYKAKYSEYRGQFKTDEADLTKKQAEIKAGQHPNDRYNESTKTFEHKDITTGEWKGTSRYNSKKSVWEKYDSIDGEWKKTLKDDSVRKPYDAGREIGKNGDHKDHQIAAATIIRDPEAGAFMTQAERVDFATSDVNLNNLDGAANISKNDHDGEKWAKHERTGKHGTGQTNEEYFGLGDEFLENERKAKEEYNKRKSEAKKKAEAVGKKSREKEFFRIGGKALRTAIMSLLTALVKEIIGSLVKWFKSDEKSFSTLIVHIKLAINSFIEKLKSLCINTADFVVTTIATSIYGPVIGTIKKTITLLKQGMKSLKDAIQFLRNPENRGKPLRVLLPQVGIIVVSGLCGVSAIVLGEFIEKSLMGIPFLAVDIPLLGSPASLIGMLMGAIVCGIIGAIAIHIINKYVAKQQRLDNLSDQIDVKNEAISTLDELASIRKQKFNVTQEKATCSMAELHQQASDQLLGIVTQVTDPSISETQDMNNEELSKMLQGL